ncbi:hypothetical protein IU427_31380 [Nocardia beijingensis]|uniref:hypothetical protein n=1 Tax=Nocardia beijingensis TaxID=95162 RepID=UPI001893A592|nr:hypothetical protein [Nocardia beijingensis]MBF6469635.1 hypothetical protein [Nocardia beijingensis]
MKGGGRIALGVGIGYFLGRTRKMRFAMSLAGAAMARRSAAGPGGLLERGTELLRSTPELTRITDTVRGELVGAVRSAAVTAASNRIDALSDRLQQGATLLTDQRETSRATDSDEDEYESSEYDEQAPEDEEQDEDRAPEDEYEDEDQAPEDEDEDEERTPDNELEEEDEDEDEEQTPDDEEGADQDAAEDDTERPAARTRTRRSSTAARRASSRSADRSSDSADRKPSGTGGRRSRAEAGQAPVRRTRR